MKRFKFVLSISSDVSHSITIGLLKYGNGIRYKATADSSVKKHHKNFSHFTLLESGKALHEITVGNLDPKRVLVIQHGIDKISQQLIRRGAIPFMLMIFESPLYAGRFYDRLENLENDFLFSQIFLSLSYENDRQNSVRFPSFSLEDSPVHSIINWKERKFASMVVANKYVALQTLSDFDGVESFFWILANKIKSFVRGSPAPKNFNLRKLQLQDKRLEAIVYFKGLGQLDLYGRGWNSLWRIPPRYRKQLALILKDGVVAVDNKIETISKYKFNLCFENVRYPGYVTEKIFDAMMAGTIPVYYGAPDIADFVPPQAFIDASKFSSLEDLHYSMANLSLDAAMEMLNAAHVFLHSKEGMRFSNEAVVSSIGEKIEAFINA